MKKFTLILVALVCMAVSASAQATVEQVCGAYDQNLTFQWYDYTDQTITSRVVISQVEADTLSVVGFWGSSSSLKAIFDAETQTIRIPSYQTVNYADYSWSLYGVTYETSEYGDICTLKFSIDTTDGVVLTALSQPTLGYDYYGDGYYYDYSYYGAATLTRTGDVQATTVKGSSIVALYNDAGELEKYLFADDNVDITMVENGIYDYRVANWCGTGEEINLTNQEDGTITIGGGDEYGGYSYYYYPTTDIDCISPYYEDGEMSITATDESLEIVIPYTYWADYTTAASGYGVAIVQYPADKEGVEAAKQAMGINSVAVAEKSDATYYNVAGQRVNSSMKGLLINGGKKVVK